MIRADYYEYYWNQSLKIQMAFEWAARYCKFSYLLKADDDVLVNTKDLIKFLQRTTTPNKGLFMGMLHHNPKVRREGKWNVSYEEYNRTHYPDFCSGAGFVMSYDVVECLVPLFGRCLCRNACKRVRRDSSGSQRILYANWWLPKRNGSS